MEEAFLVGLCILAIFPHVNEVCCLKSHKGPQHTMTQHATKRWPPIYIQRTPSWLVAKVTNCWTVVCVMLAHYPGSWVVLRKKQNISNELFKGLGNKRSCHEKCEFCWTSKPTNRAGHRWEERPHRTCGLTPNLIEMCHLKQDCPRRTYFPVVARDMVTLTWNMKMMKHDETTVRMAGPEEWVKLSQLRFLVRDLQVVMYTNKAKKLADTAVQEQAQMASDFLLPLTWAWCTLAW